MQIHLIAVGTRMPGWVNDGYAEYARRLPRECSLKLNEIPLAKRSKSQPLSRAIEDEGRRMQAVIGKNHQVIALDVKGHGWSTDQLAGALRDWMRDGRDVSLLVGGPDGLADDCLQAASQRWSLSPLTLPHPLVRVILAEQLYRAWSLNSGHPYHRG
ncbi:23S rRNA (pseudouridine1915-N3)-methyltransferase [Thiogranum longum]|uniref:Ribosomal RNA large subunit methyltransferase H n=1 Tax=Thiogranum longum TaxID=1537524 RepID=A0A4R1HAE7_9GAMM|nr:23S rRNA (pseudouridine(1915)-N(3))-methyltransferase RlmH [Thiogranum longum]TCK17541.1 23S rRNA (pseudouridine1915-N3)-methyltransferase [Thiogranum longum]